MTSYRYKFIAANLHLASRIAGVLTLLVNTSIPSVASEFVARGNEPGWVVRITPGEITFSPMTGDRITVSPVPASKLSDGIAIYRATAGTQEFRVSIAGNICVDTMSGMPHPASVKVEVGRTVFVGCGGKPETLLHGEWDVDRLDDKPVMAGSSVTMRFNDEGQLSGNASCNRFVASYALTGESLTITKAAASMMMCQQELMDQERIFLDLLGSTTQFEIPAEGALLLRAGGKATISARRKN